MVKEDIEFLKAIVKVDEKYPTTNPWREVVPLQHVLTILEKYQT